ncbi:unnamed protein product [Linum tenue]|uniref:Cytochrome P450 n=1 Tax=Linum tenue TaxID=586396 RepID=A0AAV0RVY7_9ROSI|nr:unnamed protein product [Linum tenue]
MSTIILLFFSALLSLLLLTSIANYTRAKRLIFLLRNASQAHDLVTRSLKLSGGTFVFKIPFTHCLITSDPQNAHHVFSKRHSDFPKGPEFKDILEALGEGIFNSDGEFGLTQRRILHSLFNSTQFERVLMTTLRRKLELGLLPVLDRAASAAAEEVIDLQDVFKRFMFDSICTTVLGFDPNYLTVDLLPDLPYAEAYDDMEEAVFYRHIMPEFWWKLQRWLRVGEERKLHEAWEKFDGFLYERVKLKRQSFNRKIEHKETEHGEFDLLTAFMRAAEDGEEEKSDKLMRDTAFNLIAAGRDTVTVTLVWLLWLVASNPEVEKKILEEIKANLGGNRWRFFGVEELNKLVYLQGAVCEALRLYPPVPFEHRTAAETETLPSGHTVRKNGRVLFSIYSMGRMEEIWGGDWMVFRPERWLSPDGSKNVHIPSYKFMTFAAGPRACLGKKITFVHAKQVASAVLCNYKVEVVEGHRVSPAVSIVLFMKDGLKVRVSRRK